AAGCELQKTRVKAPALGSRPRPLWSNSCKSQLKTMEKQPGQEVTALLKEWAAGDRAALGRLMPLVYEELRRLAASQLRAERRNHTLQPTALVHEAYMRLI